MRNAKAMIGGLVGGVCLMLGFQAIGSGMQSSLEQPQGAQDPVIATDDLSDHIVEACKASMALMNDRDPSTISGHQINGSTAHVSWASPDGKTWQARCEIVSQGQVRWAAYNAFGDGNQGRWRDEDRITATIEGAKIVVDLDQLGATKRHGEYQLAKLSDKARS